MTFISLDECRCPCHTTGAIHIMPCCTGISKYAVTEITMANKPASHRAPDQDIIDAHSTPGLKRGELSRSAKKDQLMDAYKFMSPVERDQLLDQLYGPQA